MTGPASWAVMVSTALPRTTRWRFTVATLLSLARTRATELAATAATKVRKPASALLELAGAAAAVKGFYVLAPWLGWLTAGAMLLVAGWLLEPKRKSGDDA